MSLRLYLGCSSPPFHPQHIEVLNSYGDGWEYIDKFTSGEWEGKQILPYDVEALPYEKETVDTIYNSHLLEHIPFVRVPQVLHHWYSLLKQGGELMINVPDLEWICEWYLKLLRFERTHQQALFVNNHYHWTHNWDLPGNSFIQMFYGSQQHEGEFHYSGYSTNSLQEILERTGFKNIRMEQVVEAHDMGVIICKATK